MGKNSNIKKNQQLGMPYGTAMNRLRKMILFKLLKEASLNWCYQCNEKIEKIENLSIEHKVPWLDSKNPIESFFNLNNVAFSHLSCNCSNAKKNNKGIFRHPSINAYRRGCRCPECKKLTRNYNKTRKKAEIQSGRSIIK